MKILLLGATGSIGSALLPNLVGAGHHVLALARSDAAANRIADAGAQPVRGDLRAPESWVAIIDETVAIIHAAATFTADMGAVDRHLIETMMHRARLAGRRQRFIATGGSWLFGATGDAVASETSALDPVPGFDWMAEHARMLLASNCFRTSIVHPASVYEDGGGGVLARFSEEARAGGPVEIWGSAEVRWPLVHHRDLAEAYRLVLEAGSEGEAYCVAAEQGVRVGRIVEAVARRFGNAQPPRVLSREQAVGRHGGLAIGPATDQQMSSEKIKAELGWQPAITDFASTLG